MIAWAQTPPGFEPADPSDLAWPSTWAPPGTFGRTAVGEFTGDRIPDVVSLAGSIPVVLVNPAYYDWQHALPVAANDLDVAPGRGTMGRDAIAVVNGVGLQLVYIDAVTPAAWTVETVATTNWKDAYRLRCGDIDGVGDLDSFGVEFDHLLIVRRLGGASVDSVFHPPHPVVDLAFVQWDADASQEIALMYADGVDVFDSDGAQFATPLASFQLGGAISMCAVAPAAGTPNGGGRIAALHVLGGVKSLSTLSPVGPSMSTLALPSTLNYFRIASGDADADGDGDLVFTDGRVYGPFYLRNDSPNDPWFAAPESWTAQLITEHPVLLDVSASNNQARPVFADLTGDGRADLLLALQRTTNNAGDPQPAHLFLEAQAGGQSFVPTLPPALFRGGFQSGLLPANLRTAVLRIDLAQITPLGNTINGVEVTVWRQPYFGATIDTGFVYRAVHPLVTPSPANTIGVAVDFVDPAVCFTNLYWVQVMPVSYSGSPTNLNVTNIGHPFFGALAMDEDAVCGDLTANGEKPYWITGGNNTALTNLPGMSGCYDYDSCGVYFGTAPAGAVVGRRRLPPLSPNTMSNDANAPHVRALEDHTLSY